MSEAWHLRDHPGTLTGDAVVQLVHERIHRGELMSWLRSDAGRVLAVGSNGSRAMVMLLEEPGDPGEHAIDPTATGRMDGYVLENGQNDTYDNRDTVALREAMAIVRHIVEYGRPPTDVAWQVDR